MRIQEIGIFLALLLTTSSVLSARAADIVSGGGTRTRLNLVLTDRLGPWVAGRASGAPGMVLDAGILGIDSRVTPIAWLALSAEAGAEGVRLNWIITRDSDPAGFVVERGVGGAGFAVAGFAGAAATDVTPPQTYVRLTLTPLGATTRSYLDAAPPDAPEAWYRLVGIDRSGRSFVGDPIRVRLVPGAPVFAVHAPVPNPTAARTTLSVDLPSAGPVRLRVFDIAGRMVAEPVEATLPAGQHQLAWDGTAGGGGSSGGRSGSGGGFGHGGQVAAGVYFLRLEAAGRAAVRRIVVTR